jgi:hypothetical protein
MRSQQPRPADRPKRQAGDQSVWLVAGLLVVLASACGRPGPEYVLVNRSDAILAFGPDVAVEPCSERVFSDEKLRESGRGLLELYNNDVEGDEDAWIPAGAVVIEGVPARRADRSEPLNFVVSGSAPAYVEYGQRIRPLPPCGGRPILEAESPSQ